LALKFQLSSFGLQYYRRGQQGTLTRFPSFDFSADACTGAPYP